MMPNLIIAEPEHFSPRALARLREHFNVHCGCVPTNQTACKAEVMWMRFKPFTLSRLPYLKLIVSNCTDVSHLPLEECKARGIEVLSLKGLDLSDVHATAEHTISLMLQALRLGADRGGKIGRELKGKLVGVVGAHGRIGTQVRTLLEDGFGCVTVIPEMWQFHQSDIITIHASLNETSRGMVNTEFLSKLKPGCILVNTARHAIVDEQAIGEWLSRDKAAIYAHDFRGELNRLCGTDDIRSRIIATPHIGGWTIESLHKTEELLAEKVIEWAKAKMEVASA